MELIVFDLDGTLLDRSSALSGFTRETLARLSARGIAYTVATGRTLHGARDLLDGQGFILPQIFKNGVVIWNPQQQGYSHRFLLTQAEIQHVLEGFIREGVAPFLFTLEPGDHHAIYHPPTLNRAETRLADMLRRDGPLQLHDLSQLPASADIANVSAIGPEDAVRRVVDSIADEDGLVSYMGNAIEDTNLTWVDIHHRAGSKGDAVTTLKQELGLKRVICFGDSDNDLSMFELADEAYAPDNAKSDIKAAATEVIGHHDADGIAHFLRERFDLA